MTPEEEIRLAENAKQVINNPAYQDAMRAIDEWSQRLLDDAPVRGPTASLEQQQLIMLRQTAQQFKKRLKQLIEGGKLAADRLEKERRLKRIA